MTTPADNELLDGRQPVLEQGPQAPICPRSTIGGHACTNYQPQNRCADCPLMAAKETK